MSFSVLHFSRVRAELFFPQGLRLIDELFPSTAIASSLAYSQIYVIAFVTQFFVVSQTSQVLLYGFFLSAYKLHSIRID